MSDSDPFNSMRDFSLGGHYHALDSLDQVGLNTTKLPYSIRVLLEGALRNYDDFLVTEKDITSFRDKYPEERIARRMGMRMNEEEIPA